MRSSNPNVASLSIKPFLKRLAGKQFFEKACGTRAISILYFELIPKLKNCF